MIEPITEDKAIIAWQRGEIESLQATIIAYEAKIDWQASAIENLREHVILLTKENERLRQ